jgi:hypothetical protein
MMDDHTWIVALLDADNSEHEFMVNAHNDLDAVDAAIADAMFDDPVVLYVERTDP